MSSLRTRALLGAALTTSAIVALPASASALSLPPAPPPSGTLHLELTGGAAASLDRQGVTVGVTSPATRRGDTLLLPASDVRFGRDKVLTTNSGTITFRKGGKRVSFATISTHQSNRVRIRASIDGATKTVLTATRKKSRVDFGAAGETATLNATRLRLTAAGAREIRQGLELRRLGRGTLVKAYGPSVVPKAATPTPSPGPSPTPAPVSTPGKLIWSQANVYELTAPANTNRTWLGYITSTPIGSLGTLTPSDGAVGDTVTAGSPRGANVVYTTTFPMASSTANAVTKTGVIRFAGLITYNAAGHGITVTVQNPRIEFDGTNTARLYATGLRTGGGPSNPGGTEPYDDSQPVFTLDLTSAATVANPDNTTTLTGVVPTVAVSGHTFPSNYGAGSGPDRTPNTFGSFDVTVPNVPSP